MTNQTNDRLVHYYDTDQHRVLCGTRTAEDHSTKHRRGVTCHDCIVLLREQGGAGATAAASSVVGL
jgi:hypothetical protein